MVAFRSSRVAQAKPVDFVSAASHRRLFYYRDDFIDYAYDVMIIMSLAYSNMHCAISFAIVNVDDCIPTLFENVKFINMGLILHLLTSDISFLLSWL